MPVLSSPRCKSGIDTSPLPSPPPSPLTPWWLAPFKRKLRTEKPSPTSGPLRLAPYLPKLHTACFFLFLIWMRLVRPGRHVYKRMHLFRTTWGSAEGVTPICSDFPPFFRFVPICAPCSGVAPIFFPICSDFFRFLPVCSEVFSLRWVNRKREDQTLFLDRRNCKQTRPNRSSTVTKKTSNRMSTVSKKDQAHLPQSTSTNHK